MTTDTWTSSISAAWNVTTGWSSGATPGNGQDIYIDPGSAGAVTLTTGPSFSNSATIDVLTMDANAANTTILMNGTGQAVIQLDAQASSGLVMSAGTITLQDTSAAGVQAIFANNVTVAGSGAIINAGSYGYLIAKTNFTLSNGDVAVTASGEVDVGVTGTTGAIGVANAKSTGSAGAALVEGSGTLAVSGGTLSATAFNATGGVLTESGGTIIASGTAVLSGGTISLNGGIFQAGTDTVTTLVSMGGGTLDGVAGGVVINSGGTITGVGTVEGAVSGSFGSIIASGGVLEFTNNISATNDILNIGTGSSVLKLDGTESSGHTISFISKTSGVLELNGGTAINPTDSVKNLGTSSSSTTIVGANFINVQGLTIDKVVVDGTGGSNKFNGFDNIIDIENASNVIIGQITLASAPTALTKVDFGLDSSVGTGAFGGTDIFLGPVCFAAGTLIETDRGEVAVEDLGAGDLVVTIQDGQAVSAPVMWMGVRHIDIGGHPHPHLVAPVRIRANAFGEALPSRDLLVSPAHAIYVDGKLIPANLLINNMTIMQDLTVKSVTYYHVELESHAIILAEGLPSESYLDVGNRNFFSNAGLATMLHPEFHVNAGLKVWEEKACAPLVVDAEAIAPIWRLLADRAEAIGYVPPRFTTTRDADLYVEANGRRLRPVAVANGKHTFMLPAGASEIVLHSRTSAPADLEPITGDWRPLGVAVRGMILRSGDDHIVIPADHPALMQGWHTPEAANGSIWRWTAGNAAIPMAGITGPAMLDIDIGEMATYILTRSDREEQRLAA